MSTTILNSIFLIGTVLMSVIRSPYQKKIKDNIIIDDRKTTQEKKLLLFVLLGFFILPMIYIVSPWLGFADYSLSLWVNMIGIFMLAIALWLFWLSHHDLGKNWSPTLQIRQNHSLTTEGIYNKIRHPMYTSLWLWCIAQPLLLTNWIAGPSGIITFGTLYFLRVGNEEKMMLSQFGDQYQTYMQRTKRLLPYLF